MAQAKHSSSGADTFLKKVLKRIKYVEKEKENCFTYNERISLEFTSWQWVVDEVKEMMKK